MWSLIAFAACRSSSQSSSSATAFGALGPDRRGRVGEVAAKLGVGHRGLGRPREGGHAEVGRHAADRSAAAAGRRSAAGRARRHARSRSTRGSPPGASFAPRCAAGCSAPPMCIRHELSAGAHHLGPRLPDRGHLVGAHRRRHVRVLHRERAAEPAARLRVGQVHQVDAAHRAQQPQRGVADVHHAQRVAGGVIGHPVREVRAHVGHAEHPGQERGQVVHPRRDLGHLPRQDGVARLGRQHRVVLAHHRARTTPTG